MAKQERTIPSGDESAFSDEERINLIADDSSEPRTYASAVFRNLSSGYVSVTVWFNNGASGNSNFVLPPRQTHPINVQGGDTFSWGSGASGAPRTPRYWINYGNNDLPF
ncbi:MULTISPECIES: hypothetical protein [Klebsiella]|uniref:hypothetical protein n=1 Tax=Klebsiella TaxID=570 RepID=UPI001CD03E98|nr:MULTISPECIES: hypothetical protein [Klebsiella]MBZ7661061.1 hypothetical protein [Klebsiella grimontii]WJD77940.1 hypothetical protein QRD21_12780 [Klebsiella michiganensis]